MAKASRDKGARGELEAAEYLRKWFPKAQRGVSQARGGKDGADVEGVPMHHVEVKRYKSIAVTSWVEQADSDRRMAARRDEDRQGDIPIVMMRQDRGDWLVAMKAEHYFDTFKGDLNWNGIVV